MADLEDTIFKQNVPGRWSSHDREEMDPKRIDDDKDAAEENDETNNDGDVPKTEEQAILDHRRQLALADVPEPISRSIIADRLRKPKTGVKGVLADYKAHQKLEAAAMQAESSHRDAVIKRMVDGYKLSPEEESHRLLVLQMKNLGVNNHDEDVDEEEEEDEDEEFLKQYREKRLQELSEMNNRPKFGIMKDVDHNDFLTEIDEADPKITIIVHLYEPSVQLCVKMNRILERICEKMIYSKFLRLKGSENGINVDRMTLPILTIYKAKETVTVLAGIADELGEHFTQDDVEWFLESNLQAHGLL